MKDFTLLINRSVVPIIFCSLLFPCQFYQISLYQIFIEENRILQLSFSPSLFSFPHYCLHTQEHSEHGHISLPQRLLCILALIISHFCFTANGLPIPPCRADVTPLPPVWHTSAEAGRPAELCPTRQLTYNVNANHW